VNTVVGGLTGHVKAVLSLQSCAHASLTAAGGVSASHLDIAPRHAGVVFGVGNTAGTLAGLVAGEDAAADASCLG
jgi:hypothetical protein